MQIQKTSKIKRKNFFVKFTGLITAVFIPGITANLLKKKNKKVIIQINPDAVSRKIGGPDA